MFLHESLLSTLFSQLPLLVGAHSKSGPLLPHLFWSRGEPGFNWFSREANGSEVEGGEDGAGGGGGEEQFGGGAGATDP